MIDERGKSRFWSPHMGAEVVASGLFDLLSIRGTTVRAMVRVITGCERVYLGMSVSSGF